MKILRQTTEVISVSLPQRTLRKMEEARKRKGETRSNFIRNLLERYLEDIRWERIYKRGEKTARKFNIKSEEDVDRILHGL